MSNDQRKVVIGAIAAIVFIATFFEVVFRLTDFRLTPPGGIDVSWRLEYALKCEVFAALCLLAGVGMIANRRFFIPEAIAAGPWPSIEIERRYVGTRSNMVFEVVAHLALSWWSRTTRSASSRFWSCCS